LVAKVLIKVPIVFSLLAKKGTKICYRATEVLPAEKAIVNDYSVK